MIVVPQSTWMTSPVMRSWHRTPEHPSLNHLLTSTSGPKGARLVRGLQHVSPRPEAAARSKGVDWPAEMAFTRFSSCRSRSPDYAHAAFKRCVSAAITFLIVRHHFSAPVVGHGDDGEATGPSDDARRGRDRDQRIDAHIVCHTKAVSRWCDELSLEFVGGSGKRQNGPAHATCRGAFSVAKRRSMSSVCGNIAHVS